MSIIVNHLSYIYNPKTAFEKKAIDDVSFTLNDGEYVGLVGHTGSGKSTLIQHLNGLIKATSGGIYYNGEDIYDKGFSLKQLRGKVGLVFQYPEHQLFEEDVFKDVCFGPKNLGLSKSECELRAYEALKSVGLKDEYFYNSPFDLSGGEKRRVAIAGVLAMKPEVLILDEPTAGLDPKGREEILSLIDELHENNKITVVLVSHSMDDMAEHAKRLLVMHNGRLVLDGPTVEVFNEEALLTEIGLEIPVVKSVLASLKRRGLNVKSDILTADLAAEEINRAILARRLR